MPALPDELTLADWRRTVAELYADVRRLAASDPVAAWDRWREVRERLYREHPQSPVPVAERGAFRARHWPYDPALRFDVAVEAELTEDAGTGRLSDNAVATTSGGSQPHAIQPASPFGSFPLTLPNSGDDTLSFRRIGLVSIPFPDGERQLALFWMAGYTGGLFLPFRDATNGVETYGAGRYLLDGAKSADLGGDPTAGTLVLDFNFAFQPSCAFDPKWACPLAPPENRLDLAIRAGERLA